MTQVGEAFVVVKPVVQDFRADVARQVSANIGTGALPVPIKPTIATGTRVTWETVGGAAVARTIPVPIEPVIPAAARQRVVGEIGGLRGLLLGGGQFAASRALGISGAAAGLFAFGVASLAAVKSAATLEQELNVFQQVSGATAEQMAKVRAEARALGADLTLPAVSSGDAAATMTELAKAGLNVDQVLAGTKGTLQLAAAANLDFATAAELSANALNAFQLPGTQAVKVADLLAGAANAAQGNIADFGVALSQSAAVAHQAGLSVQETVTFLTELAKAGIQGSDAGTSLRVALLRLIAPSNEARKIIGALGVEITDAQGNVRVDVFEQLRRAMEGLRPATRNAALATIFGTDAVRSAAIFVRDGAHAHEDLARQVTRSGQAADTAAARTEGLSGTVSGLQSNLQTLGSDLGTIVLPLLTDLGGVASQAVSDLDEVAVKLDSIGNRVSGLSLGPLGTVGDVIKTGVKDAVSAPFAPLHASVDVMRGDFKGAAGDLEALVPGLHRATKAIDGLASSASAATDASGIVQPPVDALANLINSTFARTGEDVSHADGAGLGGAFVQGVSDGIKKHRPEAVRAAEETVRDAQRSMRQVVADGQRAVADAIRQGAVAVEAAAVDAKQNLTQIGDTLAQQVLDLLDAGPLAQQIDRLQARLDRSRTGLERSRLGSDLKDARKALADAEAAAAPAPGEQLTAAQRRALDDFLRPFRQRVKDAQAALAEFNTEGNLDKLRARLDAQKARIQRILDDVVARFNAGLLSAPAANAEVARLLERNVGPMGRAGQAQGFAFRQRFQAELAALQQQIALIVGGPGTAKTGAEPHVVSPGAVAAQARLDIRDARDAAARSRAAAARQVTDAVRALHRAELAAVTGPGGTNPLLKQILAQLSGRPVTRRGGNPGRAGRTGPR